MSPRETAKPACFREPSSTTRETHLPARCRRRSKSRYFAPATRIPRLPMRFRLRRASRRSRWFTSASLLRRLEIHVVTPEVRMETSPRDVSRRGHLPARCRQRSKSRFFAPATRIPRLTMRFLLRSESCRSYGGLAPMFCGAANAGPPTRQPRWGAMDTRGHVSRKQNVGVSSPCRGDDNGCIGPSTQDHRPSTTLSI